MLKKILLSIIILFLSTGCWNYRELNEMAIVGSIGIDFDYESNEYTVSTQIFNAKKNSSNNESGGGTGNSKPITLYSHKANTIHEALRNILEESPKKLYIGHVSAIILSESLLKEKLMDSIDFLFRDAETRKDFILLATKGCSAKDVLKILTPLETVPSESIYETIYANNKNKGSVPLVTFDEALSVMYKEGQDLILPAIKIIGDIEEGEDEKNKTTTEAKTKIKLDGSAIFKDNKLVDFISADDTVSYNFINNNIKNTVVSFACDDEENYGAFEILRVNSKMKTTLVNEEITTDIKIKGKIFLSEINCDYNLIKVDVLKEIEKMINNKMENMIIDALSTTQTDKSDIYGIGNQIYKKYNKEWQQQLKKEWDEKYLKVNFKVKSDLIIKNKSSIIESAKAG